MDPFTLLITAALVVYFLPTLIAVLRDSAQAPMIIVLNFVLGWTGLGWLGLVFMAAFGAQAKPRPAAPASPMAPLGPRHPSWDQIERDAARGPTRGLRQPHLRREPRF